VSTALATLVEEKRLARGAEGGALSAAGVATGTVTVAGADAAGLRRPVLLTAPTDPVRVGEANRTLARLGIPWRFGAIARDLVLTRAMGPGRSAGARGAAASDTAEHPLDEIPVRLRYPLVRSPGATAAADAISDTLAVAGGAPWIVSGADYVLVGSPLEPDATDFPVRAGFLPWLLDALSRRLGDDGRLIETHPGAHLTGFEGISALERSDGSLVALAGDRITVPNEAGVYFLRRQSVRAGALVVNPEPAESERSAASVSERADGVGPMLARVSGRTIIRSTDGAGWRKSVLDQAVGRSLLPPLLAIALAVLLLEAWLARDRVAAAAAAPAATRARAGARAGVA